jgi:hypothetical protein
MALRRALEILKAGEQANDRLYRLTVDVPPPAVRYRWTDGGTRRRPEPARRANSPWSLMLGSAHEAT